MKYKYSRKTVLRNLNLFLSPLFSGQRKLEVIKHYLFAKAPVKEKVKYNTSALFPNLDDAFKGLDEAITKLKLSREHDQELIKEGKSMSDRDTRRGV